MLKEGWTVKIISVFLTLLVIIILLVAGPAQAVILSLISSENEVVKGDSIVLTASIERENKNEIFDIRYVTLRLEGPMNGLCRFDYNGNVISGCRGMTIKRTSEVIGYGYYNPNVKAASYDIIIDTSQYTIGDYKASVIFRIGNANHEQKGANFTITSLPSINITRCSIRANDGLLSVDEIDLDGNNKINFYLPEKTRKAGRGSLSGQKGKERLSYSFTVDNVIENNKNQTSIAVTGEYKLGRSNEMAETSVIVWDKKTNTLSLFGENINIKNMKINFIEGCRNL